MYKAKCAECGAHWNSKAFKSRPAGRDIPPVDDRRLHFAFASNTNNKICHACYLKNQRLRKRQRDEQRDEQQEEQQHLQDSSVKRLRLDEQENSHATATTEVPAGVAKKEGIAVSVLLLLSMS
jgi:hypothetical protein